MVLINKAIINKKSFNRWYKNKKDQNNYPDLLVLIYKPNHAMKNHILFIFFLCVVCFPAFSQSDAELEAFNHQRLLINQAGMITLGAWAAGNFIVSGIGWNQNSGSSLYFHQGNVMWNTVNFALAGFGLYGSLTALPGSFGLAQTITEQYSLEKILLFNAGLDIGYMATGLYLIERAKHINKSSNRFKGYGQALILQGGFLFLFDLVMFAIHNQHGKALDGIIPVISATGQGFQVGLNLQF